MYYTGPLSLSFPDPVLDHFDVTFYREATGTEKEETGKDYMVLGLVHDVDLRKRMVLKEIMYLEQLEGGPYHDPSLPRLESTTPLHPADPATDIFLEKMRSLNRLEWVPFHHMELKPLLEEEQRAEVLRVEASVRNLQAYLSGEKTSLEGEKDGPGTPASPAEAKRMLRHSQKRLQLLKGRVSRRWG